MKRQIVLLTVLLLVVGVFSVLADDDNGGDSGSSDSGGDSDSSGGDSSGSDGDSGDSSSSSSNGDSDNSKDTGDKDSDSDSKDSDTDDDSGSKDVKADDGESNEKKVDKDSKEENEETEEAKDRDSDGKEEKEETKVTIDENGVTVEVTTKTEIKDGKTETEEVRTFIDESGNEVEIKTKTEIKDGKSETIIETKTISPDGTVITEKREVETKDGKEEVKVERKITNPDGTEIKIETKTEIKDGKEEVKNSITVKGAVVTTKLKLKEETEANQTRIKATLSTGAEQEIITLPDEALQTAFAELQSTNNFTFELKEVQEGEKMKAVFSATAVQEGRLLGIFDTQVQLETLIDTATGEIIRTERPWWAFLIVEQNEATVCHVNNPNSMITQTVLISEVKSHLAHGDNVGACVAICGDRIVVEGVESCETGETKGCTTAEEYAGTQTCSATCDAFEVCTATESCGDGVVNGSELCDDGNVLSGDGCNSSCQVEVPKGNSTIA